MESNIQLMPENTPAEKQAKQTALEQYRTTIEQLSSNPPIGRVSLGISSNITRWKNTSADIEVRAGDALVVPKRPSYILVTGQVFNPTAIAYRPGKSAAWYLGQAGGATLLGDKKAAFVIRANGSIISSKGSLWSGNSFGAASSTRRLRHRAREGDWRTARLGIDLLSRAGREFGREHRVYRAALLVNLGYEPKES